MSKDFDLMLGRIRSGSLSYNLKLSQDTLIMRLSVYCGNKFQDKIDACSVLYCAAGFNI
jgi:hypothetical protein